MSKQPKSDKGVARKAIDASQSVASGLIDTNRAVWLAGLGAFSSLGKITGAANLPQLDALVKAGEMLEARSRDLVESGADAVRKSLGQVGGKVDQKLEEFEGLFDRRVAEALSRLGIPSRAEVAVLLHRIETLEAEIVTLRKTKSRKSEP